MENNIGLILTENHIKTRSVSYRADKNNKVKIKYSITALDLSRIGLDVDDFEVHNTHPVKNKLLGIDDTARINRKSIDVCEETKTSFEIGESFKTLRELQREQAASVGKVSASVAEIIRNYATNKALASEISRTISLIEQTEERINLRIQGSLSGFATTSQLELTKQGIMASVSESYASKDSVNTISGELSLKINTKDLISELNASADVINLKSNRLTISSTYFTLTADGKITATSGKIGDWTINGGNLVGNHGATSGHVVTLSPSTLSAVQGQDLGTLIDIGWHDLIASAVSYRARETNLIKAAACFNDASPVSGTKKVTLSAYKLTFTNGILTGFEN
jgi:hypothetical protein